jgi:hypothetical protein
MKTMIRRTYHYVQDFNDIQNVRIRVISVYFRVMLFYINITAGCCSVQRKHVEILTNLK